MAVSAKNIKLMIAGMLVMASGFLLLSGGGSDDQIPISVIADVDMNRPVFLTLDQVDCQIIIKGDLFLCRRVLNFVVDLRTDILFYDNH